jgi:hypothetical protein
LQGNLDVSHRLIGNLEARPSRDVDHLTESIDVELVPIPEFDLDFMDLDFSTPRIPARSSRYSIPGSPCPLGATGASTTKTVLSRRSQPSLPFRSRTPSFSNISTAFVSSLAPRGIYGWQDSPLILFWDLPGICCFSRRPCFSTYEQHRDLLVHPHRGSHRHAHYRERTSYSERGPKT